MSKGKRMVDSNSNKSTNKKYKNVIMIFFILIMLAVILILFIVFKKTSFKKISPKKIDNTVNIIEEATTDSSLDSESNNKAKTIVGNDNIEISNFKINNAQSNQSSVSLTFKNNSSEDISDLNLSVELLDSNKNIIISFYNYINKLSSNSTKTVLLFTKDDISQVTDFLVTLKE